MISSLASVLNSAIRSMQTAQYGMGINSENIAHANDPNYTVRSLDPSIDTNTATPAVQRLRDAFVDDQYRLSNSAQGEADARKDILSQVESIFGDPVNGGIATTMTQFFDAWRGLAENPADGVSRLQLISAANGFVDQIKTAYNQLSSLQDTITTQMTNSVDKVNSDLTQVANLNNQIMQMERNNLPAADLQDQRDKVLDELANLTGATSSIQPDGSVRVIVGSTPVLDGPTQLTLTMSDTAQGPTPSWPGFATPTFTGGGAIAGLLTVRNTEVTDLMSDVASLGKTIAQQVNALHGDTTNAGSAMDFFTIGPGAVDFEVNRNLSASDVQAGYDPTAPSDSQRARDIAALQDSPMVPSILIPGTQAPNVFYRNLIGLIGNRAQEANQDSDVAKAHTDAANTQRQSEWGVSLDEEMANLMLQQRAFQAAARVINATDTMFDFLINRTGQ